MTGIYGAEEARRERIAIKASRTYVAMPNVSDRELLEGFIAQNLAVPIARNLLDDTRGQIPYPASCFYAVQSSIRDSIKTLIASGELKVQNDF